MTSRQLRKQRRAAERAQRKLEQQSPTAPTPVPAPPAPLRPGHPTGPRTDEGKRISSRNSLKHGLSTGELLIPGENPADFEIFLQALLTEHAPANPTERLLVQQMAQSFWLAQRAIRLQSTCFSGAGEIDTQKLALFLRYQTTHERAFHKALSTLQRLHAGRTSSSAAVRPIPPPEQFVSQTGEFVSQPARFVSQKPEFARQNPPDAGFVSQNPPLDGSFAALRFPYGSAQR